MPTRSNSKPKVPKLRFPGFVGEWVEKRLGDLTQVVMGQSPSSVNYNDHGNGLPLIQGNADIYNRYARPRFWTSEITKECQPGDLILTVRAPSGFIAKTNIRACIGRGVSSIKYKNTDLNFIYQFLLYFEPQWSNVEQGSTFTAISGDDIKKVKLCLPLKNEQQKISDFLSVVDERIAGLSRKKELLEQYKKGVMQKIFSQKLRFKQPDGSNFPDWDFKYGNEIFNNISDKNHNSDLPILAITQEFGAIPRELIEYEISVTDKSIETYKVVQVGDFIISLRSFQGGVEYSKYKGICSPAYIVLRPKIEIADYLYKIYMKSDDYITELNRNLEGIRDGKMISYKYFSEIELPYPSLEEQQKIADFLSSLDEQIEQVNQQIEKSKTFKKALLQQMFV